MTWFALPLAFADAPGAPGYLQFVPILLIFAIFYFVLIAPSRKRQKSLQQLIENLKKGDRVVTNGGLYGSVAAVEEKWVVLRVADHVKVRIAKSAISGFEAQEEAGGRK
ncbi:MAG: preprotein translocase subunit YajC [Thermoanaerobaculia bacterium]